MRLLHVIHSVDPRGGGPIEALSVRARLLAERGHQVEVASCDDPAAPFVAATDLLVHALGPGIGKYGYAPRLKSWLRRHHARFDSVIVNGIWQYHAVAVRRALQASGRPYLLFPHGMLDPWFRERYPLKHLKKLPYWLAVERRNLAAAAAVLFTSEEEQVRARESFPAYRATESVVPYGISPPERSRDAYAQAFAERFPDLAARRFILFLGRLHEKKGCDLLIDAFARVASADPDLHLVMAGPGSDAFVAEQQRTAVRLGIASRIAWPGMLRGDLKFGALATADAFVLPSHQENFGVAVAEALAFATPVLISDKVNIWREIDTAGAGFIDRDDGPGTTRLLRRWIGTAAEDRAAMSAAALRLFHARYDMANSLECFLDLLWNASRLEGAT